MSTNSCARRSPDIYAAGDVAAVLQPGSRKTDASRARGQRELDGPIGGPEHGGHDRALRSSAFFLFRHVELGYEAVGEVDSRLETFADWKRPNEEGVVYYLKEGRVRGVLLWNVWEQVQAARKLIAAPDLLTGELEREAAGIKNRHS